MCGIAGVLGEVRRGGLSNGEIAAAMGQALIHRGPDAGGVWRSEDDTVAFAHRRLSIVDLSATGAQPMRSGSGRYIITFNGEIYNYRTLRKTLQSEGHDFRGSSDTEVILAAVEQWGVEAAISRLKGMFAFAVGDAAARALYLVRDRMGEKPLYYGRVGGGFIFGSELKSLCRHPEWRGDIDEAARGEFMRLGYIPAPATIYKNISKLPPGCFLRLPAGSAGALQAPAPTPYWSVAEKLRLGVRGMTRAEAVERLHHLLSESIKLQMVADVPVGAFLSGGIDSSAVVAIMQQNCARRVKTFTIGFADRQFDESGYAREIARRLETDHTEVQISGSDAARMVPDLARVFDEPFADSSQIPTWFVSDLARQHVKVSLSGDGGDELFAGYNTYGYSRKIWSRIKHIPKPVRNMLGRSIRFWDQATWQKWGERLQRFSTRRAPGVRRFGYKVHKVSRLLGSAGLGPLHSNLSRRQGASLLVSAESEAPALAMQAALAEAAGRDEDIRLLTAIDLTGYLPGDILTKVDRAAMSVSLETRIPLLDHDIVEFALALPAEHKIGRGGTKAVLRDVLSKFIPSSLFDRPKRGFGIPLGDWLRSSLREWVEAQLSPRLLADQGVFDPQMVTDLWQSHLAGTQENDDLLWPIIMYNAWAASLKD